MNKIIVITLVSLVLSSCSSSKSDVINRDFRRIEDRLNDVRSLQAEQTTDVSSMQQTIRELTGRLETLERKATEVRQAPDYQNTLPYGNNRAQEYDSGGQNFRYKEDRKEDLVPGLALLADKRVAVQAKVNGDSSFYEALISIGEGKFSESIEYINKVSPEIASRLSLQPYLYFWNGVALEAGGQNIPALEKYGETISAYPRHKRAAQSLYRQATIFKNLGDIQTSKITLDKLINDFPGTKESFEAKKLKETL